MSDWNPSLYLHFSAERSRPAVELLARVPLENVEYVADLGCGPGNSTALLGVVCGRGRNPTLRLWPTIFSGKIDVFPGDRRSRLISSMTSVAPA